MSTATETKLPPAWRPVEQQLAKPERTEAGFRYPLRYGIHLIAAFVVGVLVLAIVAAVAALVTNGSVAVLRVRGLPILLAAGTAIVVFALLRTSRRASVARSDQRTREVGAILIGFVVLLAACALVARPVTADAAQARIERTLRVFGPADRDAVSSFQGDIDEWNVVEADYQRAVADVVRDKTPNLRRFQRRATRGDDLLRELATRMETHAGQASNPRLRDGLSDLAAVYQDRFAGLRLVERGILSNDFTLVPVGDETFKRARTRARALFRRELGTLIEQAGGDAATFGRSLSP